ncbi:acetyl/propionyl/methylcrotonyl-CoA carboxylase subunit alpha [Streptomyces sp. MMS21 TC-5]|uniref:acetyl-CoA carboxylase biotin carboxylase subunit n=1 Tax=Streptomyces TaxID=1883 RepID=UPI0006AF3DCB|nr:MULTISPECIES: acetyl/propionyl/methylcrotonyl-CoA carboxylase subunit alpha [unclassified Streptomyces]KOU25196.1 acetyl-COA carboxylase [Streptomyces sp. WM6349]KOV43530.1 acetyl-COA carboxylase [Streptomyces sp. H036]MCI4081639.1 acetyl/propionyl/methylcrotonyl-CoA carboxylase subunit alpha [Streptomyces sp. MMS21 TC-5]QNE27242.1 acetyl/propionyl/methylcrotonyl-CoA carboxylase subunit alpha [Streptomyces sp. INR7]
MFSTVLVANRGEIAVRVIRTLRELGIRSVAVFSDADADARHVREADTAVRIGPAAAAESYLSVERLLDAAKRTGAEAVHPGYGFLAENAAFAQACTDAGLAFIGPPASAISLMGDKIRAKETVKAAGVPVVPGSSGSGLSDAELVAAASEIGMPVLLKPSAGGGGKGMRLVRDEAVLAEEIAAARREARSSFGDDTLLVERWVDRPRHIEIQVLADAHGNVVHLGERECSLQRRHQKVIEEAPSVLLDEKTRAAMGAAAVDAARSCGYVGAGTVEFIVPGGDPSSYYFMEMNTRLQVEHPVTELITGLDLVELQLRVASGEALPVTQDDIRLTGHAIEARVCAEDPARGFLPSGGTVLALSEPSGGAVRTDSGLTAGVPVGSTYDPMLSKVIVHGPDRPAALRMLRAALADTVILGVQTNAGFLRRLLAHPDVVSGDLDTGLVERDLPALLPEGVPAEVYATAALLAGTAPERRATGWTDPFDAASGWRLGGTPAWTVHHFRLPGQDPVEVRTRPLGGDTEVLVSDPAGADSAPPAIEARGPGQSPGAPARARIVARTAGHLTIELDGVTHRFSHAASPEGVWLGRDADSWHVQTHDPVVANLSGAGRAGADTLAAPMPGTVTVVKVAVGDKVTAGQSLLVVEAMKMEHVISAPHAGTVTELDVSPGTTVAMDQVLAVVTPDEEEDA